MQNLLKAIVATIAILSLVTYDFLSLCRIIGKEKWVEKIYNSLIPTPKYNEDFVFRFIRPLLLTISMMTYLLVPSELSRIPMFYILLAPTTLLACGANLKGMFKPPSKDDTDEN